MGANKNSDRKEYHKSSTNHRAQKSRQDKQADRPTIATPDVEPDTPGKCSLDRARNDIGAHTAFLVEITR